MSPFQATFIFLATIVSVSTVLAQAELETRPAPNAKILTEERWKQVDESVGRGLQWLATQQQRDGSFRTLSPAQPGVTSFCLMAFLAQGESPADGQYQQQLAKAVDYIIAQQKPNGLIARTAPGQLTISRYVPHESVGETSVYNHAISGLALAEVYGQCNAQQAERISPVIERAIKATLEMQQWKDKKPHDVGGWRYLGRPHANADSDLSITGWQLMFLRAAKNAGFDVPEKSIDAAVNYVETCFLKDKDRRVHAYVVKRREAVTRAMAGAGVLAMAHAGKHDSQEARDSGDWILAHGFSDYNSDECVYACDWLDDRYHYGAVICTQAMFQLGGKYWEQFFPPLVDVLLANQRANGSWPPEKMERPFGSCYSTSLCILSLTVPNQILPIFQR